MSVLSDLLEQAKGLVSALEAEVAKEVPALESDAEKAADSALDQATGESEQSAPAASETPAAPADAPAAPAEPAAPAAPEAPAAPAVGSEPSA